MRNLASVQRIAALSPIEGADAIEVARILGWNVVVKKGEFKVDDLCIYCEIDSILPEKPEFEFLRPRKFRIKTVKLRGQISQGIAFPLNIVSTVNPAVSIAFLKEGDDVTEPMGVKKYDPEQESMQVEKEPTFNDKNPLVRTFKKYRYLTIKFFRKLLGIPSSTKKTAYPSHLFPKTDETRVQNLGKLITDAAGTSCYVTEKLEGQSASFYKYGKKVGTCSRNMQVHNTDDPRFAMDKKYKIFEQLKKMKGNYAMQGELVGGKIQGNLYELPEHDIYFYYVYDIDNRRKLNYEEFMEFCNNMGVKTVPVLDDNFTLPNSIDELVQYSIGYSQVNPKKMREGVVIVNKYPSVVRPFFSMKSINPEYLLKQVD